MKEVVQAEQDLPAQQDQVENAEPKENAGMLVIKETLDHLVARDRKDSKVGIIFNNFYIYLYIALFQQDHRAFLDHQEDKEHLVMLATLEPQARLVQEDQTDNLVSKEKEVHLVHLVQLDQLGHRDLKEIVVKMEIQEILVPLEELDQQDKEEKMATSEIQVPPELLAPLVFQDQGLSEVKQAQLVQLAQQDLKDKGVKQD